VKVEVRCPGCNRGTLVDESSLGGEMLCPGCLTRIALQEPVAAGSRVVRGVPASSAMPRREATLPPSPMSFTAAATARGTAAATRESEEMVCPRCKLHFQPETHHADETPDADRNTILVVEDTEIFREIARDALSEEYRVETVDNTSDAHEFLSRERVSLIVLDLTLGDGDAGRSFLISLSPKPCPIVIFTAQDESEMYGDRWDDLRRLGADDVVLKGMNVGESLRRKVGALLGDDVDDAESME